MPRPSQSHERRTQIVDGLLSVIAESGYQKATIKAIAAAAGLTPGLVHHNFKDKQAILLALVECLEAALQARYDAALTASPDGDRARLDAFLEAHLSVGAGADPRAVRAWVAIAAESLRDPDLRALYAAAADRRRQLLERALAKSAVARKDRPAMAAVLLAAIEGALQLGTLAPQAIPPGKAAGGVRRLANSLFAHG